MNKTNVSLVLAIAALLLAIGGYSYPIIKDTVGASFGGTTNYDELDVTAIKIGGANGSRVGPVIAGTCALIDNGVSISATTTVPYDCAVTGVVSGDTVYMQFATSTRGVFSDLWTIEAAKASSTAGFITAMVSNRTGGAAPLSFTGIASTTNFVIMHPVTSVPGL